MTERREKHSSNAPEAPQSIQQKVQNWLERNDDSQLFNIPFVERLLNWIDEVTKPKSKKHKTSHEIHDKLDGRDREY